MPELGAEALYAASKGENERAKQWLTWAREHWQAGSGEEALAFILRQLETEAIYVTHDQVEAFAIADAVAVMREGSVVQRGGVTVEQG